jgi:hypothetical protein
MRIVLTFLAAAAVLAGAAPAHAQFAPAPPVTPHVYVFGIVEGEQMLARKSFDAVLDESSKSTPIFYGGGVEATALWKGLFARVSVTRTSNEGSRVFVDSEARAVPLNIPVTIEMIPIEIGVGWRFGTARQRGIFGQPYVGAAVLLQRYKETSEHATADENVDTRDDGGTVFAGFLLGEGIARLGLEVLYRHLPDALGAAGASEAYGETNLGGAAFRITFGVGF